MKQKPSVKTEPSELQTIFWQKMLFVGTIVLCFFPTSSRMVHILLKTDCGGKDTLAKFPQSAFMCVFFRFGFLSTAPLRRGARLWTCREHFEGWQHRPRRRGPLVGKHHKPLGDFTSPKRRGGRRNLEVPAPLRAAINLLRVCLSSQYMGTPVIPLTFGFQGNR